MSWSMEVWPRGWSVVILGVCAASRSQDQNGGVWHRVWDGNVLSPKCHYLFFNNFWEISMETARPAFELVMQSPARILNRIEKAGRMFSRFHFFNIGRVRHGAIEEILSNLNAYWRRVEKGEKVFYEPLGDLKKIHKRMALYFQNNRCFGNLSATAYWNGSSIVQNASFHTENRSSLCLDMKNAFESIKAKHVFRYLLRTGEEFEELGVYIRSADFFERGEAKILSELLTYRGRLRKGSPSSPFIFNLMCERLDQAILKSLVPFGKITYTRYGDDLCFSSSEEVFPQKAEAAVRGTLKSYRVVLNEKKTKRSGNGILEFPGVVVVRGKIRPTGSYTKKLVGEIYNLSVEARKGHKWFLHQFGRGGVPRTLKALLR